MQQNDIDLDELAKHIIAAMFIFCSDVIIIKEIWCFGIVQKYFSKFCAMNNLFEMNFSGLMILITFGIAATNREDILDKALKRRFRNKVEFTKFNENEELKMIEKFVESIDLMEMDQELIEYTKGNHTQSETMDFLVEKLIQKVSKEVI